MSILITLPLIRSSRCFEGPGRRRCRCHRHGHRNCVIRARHVYVLPSRYDYGPDSFWYFQTHLFLPSWSLSPSIHSGGSMDPSLDQFLGCVWTNFDIAPQDTKNGIARFCHDIYDTGSPPQTIHQLPRMGFRFHRYSNGFDAEIIHDRIQSL